LQAKNKIVIHSISALMSGRVFMKTKKNLMLKHMAGIQKRGGVYLFESSWNKPYTDRGIRKIMSMYSRKAGLKDSLSPNTIRTFY